MTCQRRYRGAAEVQLQRICNMAVEGDGRLAPPSGRFTPWKDPVPIVEQVGWASGLVWPVRKLSLHRDSMPGPQAHSESLYQQLFRPPVMCEVLTVICVGDDGGRNEPQSGIRFLSLLTQHEPKQGSWSRRALCSHNVLVCQAPF
jgi:hypothetical protein